MVPALHVEVLGQLRESEGGKSVPVVLLHGWRHSHLALKPLGELLAPYTEVHLIDLPGYGKSELPSESWGTQDYVDRICSYLDEKKIEELDLIGHSFGGKVSALLASKYPNRVRRLVMMNASALPPIRSGKEKARFLVVRWLGKVLKFLQTTLGVKLYHSYFIPRFASADYKSADGPLRKVFVRIVNEDFTREMPKIKSRTLLLWGEKDTETRFNIAERLLKLLPDATLVGLPGKGHEPFADAGFHLCAYYILPFLGLKKQITSHVLKPKTVKVSEIACGTEMQSKSVGYVNGSHSLGDRKESTAKGELR